MNVIEALRTNRCPTCGSPIDIGDFVDLLSLREYEISGMCQKCQDEVFVDEEEDD